MENKTRGITLISLVVTIVILIILAGISIYAGKEVIKKAKLEEVKTNMLLIQAKAREYVEEANFKIGIGTEEEKNAKIANVREEIYEDTEKLRPAQEIPEKLGITDASSCYYLTAETKAKWGLEKLQNEEQYLIKFNEKEVSVEVYNVVGYQGKYSLTEIDQMEE